VIGAPPRGRLLRRRLGGLRRLRAPRRRALVAILGVVLALGGAWLWVRDSPLVAVNRVAVTGESGPDAGQIRSALIAAARNMTTLDVRVSQLHSAVAPYPAVKGIEVTTQFPHGMRIRVVEQEAVAVVVVGGRRTAVAGDGTLLHDAAAASALPQIPLRLPPGGTHLTGASLAEVELLAAAPARLLDRVSQATSVAGHGLVAQIRNGPSIYFGDASRLSAKWIAASAVLADTRSAGAVYIDVTEPQRPVAGAGPNGSSSSSSSSAGRSTSPAGG
jgi:cell division protein FtsQ